LLIEIYEYRGGKVKVIYNKKNGSKLLYRGCQALGELAMQSLILHTGSPIRAVLETPCGYFSQTLIGTLSELHRLVGDFTETY
jgi:hypothetical protein